MENELELRAKLYQKILGVMNDLGGIEPDGHNKFSNYKYVSHQRFTKELHPLSIKHKLLIIPSAVQMDEEQFSSGTNKMVIRSTIRVEQRLCDAETGYSEVCQCIGADQDTGGKSAGQAFTEADKRWKFKLFQLMESAPDPDDKTTEAATQTKSKESVNKWILNEETRKNFWIYCNEETLTNDEVHTALGVESVNDFGGSKDDAIRMLSNYVKNRVAEAEGK